MCIDSSLPLSISSYTVFSPNSLFLFPSFLAVTLPMPFPMTSLSLRHVGQAWVNVLHLCHPGGISGICHGPSCSYHPDDTLWMALQPFPSPSELPRLSAYIPRQMRPRFKLTSVQAACRHQSIQCVYVCAFLCLLAVGVGQRRRNPEAGQLAPSRKQGHVTPTSLYGRA